MTEEYITDDQSWYDMGVGERATVLGRLDATNMPAHSTSILITLTDWSNIVIKCGTLDHLRPLVVNKLPMRELWYIRVERVDEGVGLRGIAMWQRGCPPIPLENAR